MGSLPKSNAGVGSAMNDVVREVGEAHAVAAHLESGAARTLVDASNHAFVDAMATTAGIAAIVALLGAAIAALLGAAIGALLGAAIGAALLPARPGATRSAALRGRRVQNQEGPALV